MASSFARSWVSPPSHYELRNGLDAALTQIDAALAEERTRRARVEEAVKARSHASG